MSIGLCGSEFLAGASAAAGPATAFLQKDTHFCFAL